ncbi:Transcription initiation factor TFIID subunit 8 [Bienertia sinuspersici]
MSKPKTPNSSLSLSSSALSPSQFSHKVTKIAVTQILKSVGFKSSKSSALETLTRITTLFLQSLSKIASSHATFSCRRTQCNLFDIVHAIEESSLPFGFSGASKINQTLVQSETLLDLEYFFDANDEFPLFLNSRLRNYFGSSSKVFFSGKFDFARNNTRGSEIPRWLPEFPEIGKFEDVKVNDDKVLWEDRRLSCRPSMAEKNVKGKKEILLKGRRERVKFKLLGKRRNTNVCGLEDLELRNGVCRGGKRVCLIKNDDSCSSFFQQDDDEKELHNAYWLSGFSVCKDCYLWFCLGISRLELADWKGLFTSV